MRYLISETKVESEKKDGYNFEYYCDNCGTELYARFQYDIGKSGDYAMNAYRKAIRIEKCPICEAELRKELGYFMPDGFISRYDRLERYYSGLDKVDGWLRQYPRSVDEKFNYMESQRKITIYAMLKQEINNFIRCQDVPQTVEHSTAEKIKNSTEELKHYLLNLIHLENNIYSLTQRLQELYYQRLLNNKAIVYETFESRASLKRVKSEVDKLQTEYKKASAKLTTATTNYFPKVSIKYPKCPTEPVLAKPGLFNKKRVEAENAERLAKYQVELDAYENAVQRCDEEKAAMIADMRAKAIQEATKKEQAAKIALTRAKEKLESIEKTPLKSILPSNVVKELLDKEIAETEALIKNTFIARNKLYAYDIIFEKYRDVVSLSSFYEYLMSGRCSTLEGTNGAYNIYEAEIRANRVIAKLDAVISALENIKQTQYMMYKELQNINASLDSLNSTMSCALKSIRCIEANTTEMSAHLDHISKNSDVIAYNTATTAYYSKINAELTNSLGYMIALS